MTNTTGYTDTEFARAEYIAAWGVLECWLEGLEDRLREVERFRNEARTALGHMNAARAVYVETATAEGVPVGDVEECSRVGWECSVVD